MNQFYKHLIKVYTVKLVVMVLIQDFILALNKILEDMVKAS